MCLQVSQLQDGNRLHDGSLRMQSPTYSCAGCSLPKGLLPRGFSESRNSGQWASQAEHPGMRSASTLRKESFLLICSKVSHGLAANRLLSRERGGNHLSSKVSPNKWGEKGQCRAPEHVE